LAFLIIALNIDSRKRKKPMTTKTKTLAQKLLDVRRSIPVIGKDGRNTHHAFNYASIGGVLSAVRPALDEHEVLLIPSVTKTETGDLGKMLLVHVWLNIKLINADDPTDMIETEWYAQGTDTGERCVGKAYSYGLKTFLLSALQLPTDDEVDAGPAPEPSTYKPRDNGASSGGCTENQQKAIWAISCKLWPDDTKDMLQKYCRLYGLPESSRDLSKGQASELIEKLKMMESEG
jgi:hypothetical protein